MSSVSDSENDALSGSADITGSSSSGTSTSTSSSETASTTSGLVTLTSRRREGAARLEEILQVGPSTRPDSRFIIELSRVSAAPPPPAVIVVEEGASSEMMTSQASTSGREGSESSESTAPVGEPVDSRNRSASRAMRINDRRVYRRSDQQMVELAGGHPVYSVDYFTSAVTPRYLAALRREFQISVEVELRVPGENDLPSRPQPGYITLSAEYFRAGLRLPFHPFLRRALTRLNVAPAQLNANAFRILISCFILRTKNYIAKLPFRAFQNLYRMKSAPSSTGFYYFQGFKETFITKCPDSDKQFKHMWFYAGGRWLHGHLARNDLPRAERVPLVFRGGYTWTRAPHIPERTADIGLQNLADDEWDQRKLLSQASLNEYGWLGFSSTSEQPRNQQQATHCVTVARMPEPAVHYRSRTSAAQFEAIPDRPVIQRTAPEAMVHEPPPRDPSPESWGSRVADEDISQVIQDLYPTRGLQIEEPMADKRGTKRPSDEERVARLQKRAAKGFSAGALQRRSTVPPTLASQAPAPAGQASRATVVHALSSTRTVERSRVSEERPSARLDSRPSHVREDRLPPSPASRSHREEQRPRDSGAHRVLCAKFAEGLTVEVAESSKRSDPVEAFRDLTDQLIGALSVTFSGSAAARSYANRVADDIKSAETEARSARSAEKEAKSARDAAREAEKRAEDRARGAEDKLKAAENSALVAEAARAGMEESLRREQDELASVRAEHARYLEVALPAALADARAQAVEEFLGSEDFHSRLVAEYQEGMRDMKAGFRMVNPSVVGVDWSFVPEESSETATEIIEEGEVSGAARAPEEVVVLDDPESEVAPEVPAEQPAIGMELPPAAPEVPAEEPAVGQDFILPCQLDYFFFWLGGAQLCTDLGPNSVVREPQELDVCKGRWVLVGLPFWVVRSLDLTPWSENHRSWMSAKANGS
ncbi:hypothetical protein TIFTF001_028552 [Ficus carica]|uniref:Uncharacterized protein n=1 Tax=Ficus carica TaxID=3494 RepID=A0AA88DQ69_FICCA|nr:hypothetical protein TIFTF001_028552 [Ficus carica]